MPSYRTHQRQARHNEAFVRSFDLASTLYLDWVATGIFYTVLHLIDAFLAARSIHLTSHQGRDSLIWAVHDLRPIYGAYRRLKTRSEQARYAGVRFTQKQIEGLLAKELVSIKEHLASLS